MVKTHTFNGTKYHILFDEFDGICDTDDKYWLVICPDLETKYGLEVAIHEALHACNWKAKEDKVEITAKDIARFLWRLGYRRVK